MLKLLKHFGIFLVAFCAIFWISTRPTVLEKGSEAYCSIVTPIMQTAFGKTNMYSEAVKMKNEKVGVFRLKMANKAELQKQIALAKQKGIKELNVEGKEFFVDYQLFFLMSWTFLLALLLATPMTLKAKTWSLLGGSVIFLLYTLLRLYVMILDFLSNQVDIGIYQYDEFWSGILQSIAATQKMGFSILVVFIIWIFLTMKNTELVQQFTERFQPVEAKEKQIQKPQKTKKKKSRGTRKAAMIKN